MLLRKRPADLKDVWIQADFSQANLVIEEALKDNFSITYAGCASHARRPFAIYENDDPDNCSYMLHMFQGIFLVEDGLNIFGRNQTNVLAVRQTDAKEDWETILGLAQRMQSKWPPKSDLGRACAYIIRHYDKLTAYLNNPRVTPDNNFSERALRLEKMIQSSALFRTSLEGRFALDIIRTVIQTATVCGVDVKEYLTDTMKIDQSLLETRPQDYTPFSYLNRKAD
jgi:transposase